MLNKLRIANLIVLAVSIGEFPVKLFWPYGGQSIALSMGLALPLYGMRDLRSGIFATLGIFTVLMLLPFTSFFGHLDVAENNPLAVTQLVITAAFLLFCCARIDDKCLEDFMTAISLGCIWLVCVGWYRFLTGAGGLRTEHALNYWGVRYDIATRNGDALYTLAAILLSAYIPWRFLRIGAICATLPAIVLSYARSAWIATVIYFWRKGSLQLRLLVPIVIVAGTFILGYASSLWTRLLSIVSLGGDSSNSERLYLLSYSMDKIRLVGDGPGRFSVNNATNAATLLLHEAENFFLMMAIDVGLLALFAFLGIWIWILFNTSHKRIWFSLTFYLMLNSEIDNIFMWLLIGILLHSSLNTSKLKFASYRSVKLGSQQVNAPMQPKIRSIRPAVPSA